MLNLPTAGRLDSASAHNRIAIQPDAGYQQSGVNKFRVTNESV